MMINKIITRKSIILVFVFVLFCSFSVLGLSVDISSPEYLVKEANSEEIIADFLTTFGNVSMPVASEPKRMGVMALGSPASSCDTVNIQPGVENAAEHNTNKYKPLYVFRRGEMLRSKHLLKNYDPRKHGYHFAITGPNNYKFPEGSTTWSCRTSQSLPGVVCYFNLTIPSGAPVGTYYVQRSIFDKYTGEELCSLNNDIYIIFNPFKKDSDVGGLDEDDRKAYAYDSSKEGKDEKGIWFSTDEYKPSFILRWRGADWGESFILHPYDESVFKTVLSQIEGETYAENAAIKLRKYTSNHLNPDPTRKGVHYDTNTLRSYKTDAHCASQANFLVEALRSVGIPSRPVAADANFGQAHWWFHTWTEVWLQVLSTTDWYALDAYSNREGVFDRRSFGYLGGKYGIYGKQKNDLILVANSNWVSSEISSDTRNTTADVIFEYMPGFEKDNPYCSVANDINHRANWLEELSKDYWGKYYWEWDTIWSPRECSTPHPYNISVATDKEDYNVGETMSIIVNVTSNLDVTSSPLVYGEVRERVPAMKILVEKILHSFEKSISLPPYGNYQFVEYYNVSEDVITTDFFNVVVSIENTTTISFFDAKPLMSLGIKAPTAVPQDEPFTTSVTISNNQTIALSNVEVSIERLPYNLYVGEPFVKNVPSLLPGQSEVLTWDVTGISPGDAELVFNVSSENGGADKIGALITVKGYPELLMNLSNPSSAGIGENFDVKVGIENVGGLVANGVAVTLALPPELSTSESLTKLLGDMPGLSSASVFWSVKGGENGSYYIEAYASDATGAYKTETLSPVEIIKKSPYELKLEALDRLKGLRTGKECGWWFWWSKECVYERKLNNAIDYLEKSLDRKYWVDDYTLNPDLGSNVFDNEKDAIEELM